MKIVNREGQDPARSCEPPSWPQTRMFYVYKSRGVRAADTEQQTGPEHPQECVLLSGSRCSVQAEGRSRQCLHHLGWLRKPDALPSILGFFISSLESPFPSIPARTKISFHFLSHQKNFLGRWTPPVPGTQNFPWTQARGQRRDRDSHLTSCQQVWLHSQPARGPSLAFPRACLDPSTQKTAAWEIVLIQWRGRKRKNNFPRQSEQIILMRTWKWETNDTKLASLPLVP